MTDNSMTPLQIVNYISTKTNVVKLSTIQTSTWK